MYKSLVIGVAALLLASCGDGGGSNRDQGQLSEWTTNYQPRQDDTSPIEVTDGVVTFDYPTSEQTEINVLANGVDNVGQPTEDGRITARFTLTGDEGVTFAHDEDADIPAQLSLFLQRCGDDYTKDDEDYRWWFGDRKVLAEIVNAGEIEIVAPFDARDQWSNVFAKRGSDDDSFVRAVERACNVGIAFGGGGAATHGNWAEGGEARFELTTFEVD